MKKFNLKHVERLTDLPNIGKAMAEDLRKIGIFVPSDIIGKHPIKMYDMLCVKTGARHDPCVIDTFMSIVHFMDSGEAFPWWHFTEERKALLRKAKG